MSAITQLGLFEPMESAAEAKPANKATVRKFRTVEPIENSPVAAARAALEAYRNSKGFQQSGIRRGFLHLWARMQDDDLMTDVLTKLQIVEDSRVGPPRSALFIGQSRFLEILNREKALRASGRSNAISARIS